MTTSTTFGTNETKTSMKFLICLHTSFSSVAIAAFSSEYACSLVCDHNIGYNAWLRSTSRGLSSSLLFKAAAAVKSNCLEWKTSKNGDSTTCFGTARGRAKGKETR